MGKRERHNWLWWRKLWEGDYLEDLGVDGKLILKLYFREIGQKDMGILNWLRIGTNGRLPLSMEIKFQFP
jgi:hypothetical protein